MSRTNDFECGYERSEILHLYSLLKCTDSPLFLFLQAFNSKEKKVPFKLSGFIKFRCREQPAMNKKPEITMIGKVCDGPQTRENCC